MKGWALTTISNAYKTLYDGPHATPKPSPEGKIFLRIENITKDGHLDFSKTTYISDTDYPRWTKRVVPQKGDIVFSYEATLGRYAIIPENFKGCLGRRIALIRPDNKKAFGKFLYYYFFSSLWNQEIGNYLITGATVDRIPLIKFPRFQVLLPPISTQRKIAAILSTYDDLIENNSRRISILEKMAEELYREWFVRLRFPGHEKAKIVKGVPEGWAVKKLKEMPFEIIDGDRGVNYPNKDDFSSDGYCIFLNTGNIKNDKFNFSDVQYVTKQKDDALKKGKLKKNDIIITTRGTVGAIAHYTYWNVCANVRINSGMVIIRPTNISSNYLCLTLKSEYMKNQYSLFASGSAQPQLPIKDFKNILCILPDNKVLKIFDLKMDNLVQYIEKIGNTNAILTIIRDRLLTRLMSGKIDVAELDIQFPPSMKEAEVVADA